jgi:hypothetical protein
MTPLEAIADGHVSFRDWRISVAQHRNDFGGLKLWLEAGRYSIDGTVLSPPVAFGLIRVDEIHPFQISLVAGASGLEIVPGSPLADGIICRALQIHLDARTNGYTVALVSETWLRGTDLPAEIRRLVAAARTRATA